MAQTDTAALVNTVTDDQLDLVKRTVANGASTDELRLYLYDCQRHGVHPLDKLLHFTKRGGRYTPITSIDLMRTRAAEASCLGIGDPTFVGTPKGDDFAATVTVKRLVEGQAAEFTATARWSEYCPASGQNHMWLKMPHTMLGKCAEALALRKGFPKQLAGLYASEEMDQATSKPANVVDVQADVESATGVVVERAAPPEGAVYIDRVTTEDTSNKNVKRTAVRFSDGAVFSTINQQLAALAEQIAQEGCPVRYEVERRGRYTNLATLYRVTAERETGDEPTKDELTASEIF